MVGQRQILCAIDRSPHAAAAATLGAALSRGLGAELKLVHVVEPVPGSHGLGGQVRNMLIGEGREMLAELSSKLCCDQRTASEVRVGDPVGELLRSASSPAVELLILASRGRGPLKAALLGGTSARLATRTACPVIVVSPAASHRLRRRAGSIRSPTVVCGVDGSTRGYQAVAAAARLLARLGGRLHLVHAHRPAPPTYLPPEGDRPDRSRAGIAAAEFEQRLRRWLLARAAALVPDGIDTHAELVPGEPVDALDGVAERVDADFVVVASRGRGPLASALLGSTSVRLASSSSRPALIVPGPWACSEPGRGEAPEDQGGGLPVEASAT